MSEAEVAVSRVCRALARGRLSPDALTARDLSKFVGKTTSLLYHHWGSLDGFLYAVSQAGFVDLVERLGTVLTTGGDLPQLSEAFVGFGLDSPALYALMFERRYDWTALRKRGAFNNPSPAAAMWQTLVTKLDEAGSDDPDADARLLYAGLHGLVSLAASGRANFGVLAKTDREVALASARRLATRLLQPRK
ncbi:MAG: WHG domain-containing protein [Myxococcales bacterium]|nr:WHG domain-containing protein [Myxococcales bacterium]